MNFTLADILEPMGSADRLCLFDLEAGLLGGGLLSNLAAALGLEQGWDRRLAAMPIGSERTRRLTAALGGASKTVLHGVASAMPLLPGAQATVLGLRNAGFRVGVVTDTFHVLAEAVRQRVKADFSVAHVLSYRDGCATGEVTLCPALCHASGCRQHTACKTNLLVHLRERCGIEPTQVMAVGDMENDRCLLRAVGFPITYRPLHPEVRGPIHAVFGPLTEILQLAVDEEADEPVGVSRSTAGRRERLSA